MKQLTSVLIVLGVALEWANADVYMHNPRGCNDRNCGGQGDNRDNGNRLYDTQNNDKGGYSCPRSFPFPCYKFEGDQRTACNGQNTVNPNKNMVDCNGNIIISEITQTDAGQPIVPPTQNGIMYYYEGSELSIQWTQQHGFGQNDELHSNIVIQYACDDTLTDNCGQIPADIDDDEFIFGTFKRPGLPTCALRDGFPVNNNNNNDDLNGRATRTIPFNDNNVDQANADQDDCRYGRHETIEYYRQCYFRERNKGLFTADQGVSNNVGATATRQNPNGERFGYECPEESEYYPYWHWTPWRDIVNLVSTRDMCEETRKYSGNVRKKGRCAGCNTCRVRSQQPNNKQACEAPSQNGKWIEDPSLGGGEPDCIVPPRGRQNHLGNIQDGEMPHYNWTIPAPPNGQDEARCILRIRYNITPDDYGGVARFGDSSNSGANTPIFDDTNNEVKSYKMIANETDPDNSNIKYGGRLGVNVNSNQYGRTFQDRSYVFIIKKRPRNLPGIAGAKIHNLNVRGKRGNIVQTYPAVEYDFVPTNLVVNKGELIHVQWTGSDYNPNRNGNNGEGGPEDAQNGGNTLRADRNNLVQVNSPGDNNPITDVKQSKLFDRKTTEKLAFLDQKDCLTIEELRLLFPNDQDRRERYYRNCGKINTETPYFDGGVHLADTLGTFHFMSTRNNNFSNRDMKMTITVKLDSALIAGIVGGVVALLAGLGALFAYRRYRRKRNPQEVIAAKASAAAMAQSLSTLPTPAFLKRQASPTVTAQYDHEASESNELSFRKGDTITIVNRDPSGWWEGEVNGKKGLFPSSYVV